MSLRDWSLIKGGGLQIGRGGGHVKFYPYKGGGGGGKKFSHAKGGGGGHNKFWGSFYIVAWSSSHIERGAQKVFTLYKGGQVRVLPCRNGGGGGAQNVSDPLFSHFV